MLCLLVMMTHMMKDKFLLLVSAILLDTILILHLLLWTLKLPPGSVCSSSENGHESQSYFQTGDFANKLHSGDLVFMGRKDRTIKLNGQHIALEEIKYTLLGHPDVTDTAVAFHNGQGELMQFVAFIILKEGLPDDIFRSSIKSWMVDKLPLAMIPGHIVITKSLPVSTSRKVDYASLADSVFLAEHIQDELGQIGRSNLLQAFKHVLMVEDVSDDDDFFMIGGNSIAAAHLANNIGVDMRLIYSFPTPSKLCMALPERNGPFSMSQSGI
ncbi:putative acyl-activating enzyme 19 [Argentina anserina]|uniref:putative acyl-activating enzyme 19 n=1 Tax=Argentina anserina TaxID=57926 RepID=UPI0021768E33|nr:putative acyl-activating enzyme 19 [Potentilla anserina]